MPLPDFITDFIDSRNAPIQNHERERSLYFQKVVDEGPGCNQGYVHYGTFGFASTLVDSRNGTTAYQRESHHSEEIPLFYEVWTPDDTRSILICFQSFQGRSCVSLVMHTMQEHFESQNPDHLLRYTKLLPSDRRGSLFAQSPVKRLRLIKRNASGDTANRYARGTDTGDGVNIEVILSAKRKRSLGTFASISTALREDEMDGVILHDGLEFDEAIADINIGGRRRPVGIFGDNSNTGLIDVSEDIERGEDGHPTFDSISEQSDQLMRAFYQIITGTPV